MALTILGLSGSLGHDPSAALYIDGELVSAAEEERFLLDSLQRTACLMNRPNSAWSRPGSSPLTP